MSTPLLFALFSIRALFQTQARLQLENLALRHQLIISGSCGVLANEYVQRRLACSVEDNPTGVKAKCP
jgi:hypothetical protein